MEERNFEWKLEELRRQTEKLEALPALLKDLEQQGVNMAEAENRMRDTVKNAARLINGMVVVLESMQREQMQMRYSLLEKTGELKKRLDLYSEETVRRLDSAARGQEEAVRKEQSERNAFWERFEKKRAEEQKKLRSGMRAALALTAVFGGVTVALLLLFRFFL